MTTELIQQESNFKQFVNEFTKGLEMLTQFKNEFTQFEGLLEQKKEQDGLLGEILTKLEKLEKRQPVNPIIISLIGEMRRRRVVKLLGGKMSPAYQDSKLTRTVFREAARDFKKQFKIPRYDLLMQADEESAKQFWTKWTPSTDLQLMINEANNI